MHFTDLWVNGLSESFMHQPFVSTAPLGPEKSEVFTFSIFKAPVKARPFGAKYFGKIPAKSPGPPGTDNNEERQMTYRNFE